MKQIVVLLFLVDFSWGMSCNFLNKDFGVTTFPSLESITSRRWNLGYTSYMNNNSFVTCTYMNYDGFQIEYTADTQNVLFMF